MHSKEKKVPEVRFRGFSDAWEQRELEKCLTLLKDGTHGTHKDVDEGIYLLSAKNIKNGQINIDESDRKISEVEYNSIHKNFNLQKNDVLLTIVGSIGETAVLETPDNITFQRSVAYLRPDDKLSPQFLYTTIVGEKFQRELKKRQVVSAQPGIYLGDLSMIPIDVPTMDEQDKIGAFFKHLDHTIALHQRKLDRLERLKKAFMQAMFPQKGEVVPKLRFADFSGKWKKRKLGEVAYIIGGGTPSTSNPEYWDGDIDWYSPVEIGEQTYVDSSQKKITDIGLQKSSAKILPIGTVLFTSRAGIGNTAILTKEGTTNQGFQSIIPHKYELDSYFIYSRTHELKRYGEINGAGSTFVEVSGKQMAKMALLIPTLEEQTKVGEFFKQLDANITFHQIKIEKLQSLKKAYLQKMFI